jgi:hypothetical protein
MDVESRRCERWRTSSTSLCVPLIPITLKGVPADCCLLAPQDNVEIVVNADYPTLLAWLGRASVGLSTMVDEHFGINVVEFMVRCSTGL